jgi:NADH-quinone oxidoreductase subunit A
MRGYFGSYLMVGLLLAVGVAFVAVAFSGARLLAPYRRSAQKDLTYECGIDPTGDGWAQSQIRYYVYAFLYVIFAVDAVFLFPWATIFAEPQFGVAPLVEMGIFLGFLALGLLYAWRRRVLDWT